MTITVVGLGPAGPDELTIATLKAIEAHEHRFVRTTRHPSAAAVGVARSFDYLYEAFDTFDEVYAAIVSELIDADATYGRVLYAVPGSPLVAEQTVERLIGDSRVEVTIVPALSFLDLTWARLQVDPQRGGVRLIDGLNFASEVRGERGPLLVSQCHSQAVLSEVKCGLSEPPPTVTVLQRLGLPDEHIVTIPWDDLDRVVDADHLTSLWIPEVPPGARSALERLLETMDSLRERCPWDQQQTHTTLAPYAIEEAYELAEAIAAADSDDATDAEVAHLVDELGDVLFQVVFHACLGTEDGRFDFATVANNLTEKLVRRHPHVFDDVVVTDADAVIAQWEEIKRAERSARIPTPSEGPDPMEGLTEGLPALSYASKVIKRAESAALAGTGAIPSGAIELSQNFGFLSADVGDGSRDIAVGDALLAVVMAARAAGVDPERALRLSAARVRDATRALILANP